MNFSQIILDNQVLSSKVALNFKENHQWKSYTWQEFTNLVKQTANALKFLGAKPDDNIAIYADNMPQWVILDFAILSIGAVTVPIFATINSEQAEYIIEEANVKIILAGNEKQYTNCLKIYSKGTSLEHILVAKNNIELKSKYSYHFYHLIKDQPTDYEVAYKDKDDIASIIYTSGTTGEPKGVMLSHGNFIEACNAHKSFFGFSPKNENSLVFLPLSHVFEKCWSSFVLSCGGQVSFCENPKEISQFLIEVKPTAMCSVPRFFQKIYISVNEKIQNSPKILKKLFKSALNIGSKYANLKRNDKKIPFSLAVQYKIIDTLFFKKIKKKLGGNLWFIPVGGASISPEITEFFDSIGFHLRVGYGLTETSATVAAFPLKNYEYNSVGKPMTGVQIRIGAENEILIKGYGVFKGYYKKEKETKEAFTADGWFKTGDAGKFDDNGNLIIIDRIKDLMKTSNGKYICPQLIENLLTNDNFIEKAVVIGDNKPYVTALLVPNFEALKRLADSLNIHFNSYDELISNQKIKDLFTTRINHIQKHLSEFEKIKKFQLLPMDFNMDQGEITPTLKVRRKIVLEKFKFLIEDMYN
ncbi:long-chain acyl-CoA synthetase [Apibacter mensalis]|uniref:Long-chain acyl-CoA synthetase n=1 Tax=Apibacter mensalis TaxID=1586267 RepID=A0A0X3AQX3_9FLAO|nr:long-chain fatty acid--CoA ligase [Apibacter mensalis]CVK16744.1 long-chain acyl-CoA synthetase [Apibacter mensalis]